MNEPDDDSTFRALHRLVEHYTPNGALGRTLLGGPALFFSPFLFFGGMMMLGGATSFAIFLSGAFALLFSVPSLVVGLFTLWPVYLSLIGNVESAAAYPDGAAKSSGRREDAEAVLKRRYAAGDLTQEEFERRLDGVLGASERDTGRASSAGEDAERRRERARNR